MWNEMENQLATVAETLAPYVEFTSNQATSTTQTPTVIRRKERLRKRILMKHRQRPEPILQKRLKNLNVEIKQYYTTQKRYNVRNFNANLICNEKIFLKKLPATKERGLFKQ